MSLLQYLSPLSFQQLSPSLSTSSPFQNCRALTGPGTARVKLSTIVSVSVLRLLILPLIGMAMIVGGYMAGVYHAPDAVFILVMLLQNTAPTAILVHTMSAVHQNYDAEVSTLLFWQYVVSIVSSPPYIALFLYTLGTTFHADAPSLP